MDISDFEIYFLTFDPVDTKIREMFEKLGKIIVVPGRKKHVAGYVRELNRLLGNGYDVIHIHGNSGTMVIEAFLARLHQVPGILVHCHSTQTNYPLLNRVLAPIMRWMAKDLMAWGQPQIGENVTIYTNASIFGPVVIGDNAVIKAKSLITHDIS